MCSSGDTSETKCAAKSHTLNKASTDLILRTKGSWKIISEENIGPCWRSCGSHGDVGQIQISATFSREQIRRSS